MTSKTFQPQIQDHSIVLVGDFNPKIFQPAWFGAEGLIKKSEADGAKIEIIHSDVVVFSLEWLRLEVTHQRFSVLTTQQPYDPIIKDLVVGTFRLLHYTPITGIGINRNMHFETGSEEKWHRAGDILAPKGIWDGVFKKPGLGSLTMQGYRDDETKGLIRARIEPSTRIDFGLFFNINDHYERQNETENNSKEMIDVLETNWKASYSRSQDIANLLLGRLL